MRGLSLLRAGPVERVPSDLEGKLIWLTRFGQPRISNLGNGFYAGIEMHVSAKGTTFKVDSDTRFESPTAAVDQLIERMLKTLADLGVTS